MFAIIRTGGKQYKVQKDNLIFVEKLPEEKGAEVVLTDVLMIGDGTTTTVGTPLIAGAQVVARVHDQIRDDKVIVFKKKRRQNYRRKNGHRQYKTGLRIVEIVASGAAPKAAPKTTAPKAAASAAAPSAEAATPKKAPAKKPAAAKKDTTK